MERVLKRSEHHRCVFSLQLAGTGVLAVGLWLRFDSKTKSLFEVEESPTVFFTGKTAPVPIPVPLTLCMITAKEKHGRNVFETFLKSRVFSQTNRFLV